MGQIKKSLDTWSEDARASSVSLSFVVYEMGMTLRASQHRAEDEMRSCKVSLE